MWCNQNGDHLENILLLTWVTCEGGHQYWIIFRHKVRWSFQWSLKISLIFLAHYQALLETITRAPNYVFPSLVDDTHIVGPMNGITHIMGHTNEITHTFDHLLMQLALIGLKVKVLKCKFWSPSRISPSLEIFQGLNGCILVINGLHILGLSLGLGFKFLN